MTRSTNMEHVEVLRDLSEVCRAAIKAGDWKVDGACDPDSLLRHADAAIASLSAPQPPAEAQRCTCPSGDGSLRWPCPAHPPEAQPVYVGVDLEGGWIRATTPPSAPVGVELLCRVYADAYHAGHHATVEGCYVDVLPVDRDTYWREKVQEDYPEALAQQPAAVDGDNPYPVPRNRQEAAALAKLALAYLGVTSAHIDAVVARCETDLAAQPGGSDNDR